MARKAEYYLSFLKEEHAFVSDYPILAPVEDAGGQVYNVKAYGALGNGTTDDTVAIQLAINAASAAGGGLVYLPPGTYKITSKLTPLSKVKIQGAGSGNTTIAGYGTNFSLFENLAISGSPTTDIEICDMKLDGTNVLVPGNYAPLYKGIYIQYTKRMKIHDLYVYNTYATGIGTDFLIDSIVDNCTVENCGVRGAATGQAGTGANGIGIGTGAYAIESWIVSNCIAIGCGNNGIMMEDQYQLVDSSYMTVADCIAYNCKFGFRDSGVSKVSFDNCWAANSTNDGFYITTGDIGTLATAFNPKEIQLNGCYAYGNGTGTTANGFTINDAKPDGTLYDVYMTQCAAVSNSQHGFEVHNVSKVSMLNCNAHNNQNHGILAYSSTSLAPFNKLIIDGGLFNNNSQVGAGQTDGIRIGASGTGSMDSARVTNVTCFDDQNTKTQRYGISTTGTIANSRIDTNNVSNNRNAGINVGNASTSLIIKDCIGYNPIGQASITVGASPYTYTAGNSPEDVYVTGGTVSDIKKGSTTVFATSPATVHLEPNQAMTVTYTVAPTMTKDIY